MLSNEIKMFMNFQTYFRILVIMLPLTLSGMTVYGSARVVTLAYTSFMEYSMERQ